MRRLLTEAGLFMNDVLTKGRTVALRSAANVSTGGLPIDITDQVHPDNRKMAERAAKGIGLDIAGIDFMTTDITRSYHEVGGGIIEINARPGLDIPYRDPSLSPLPGSCHFWGRWGLPPLTSGSEKAAHTCCSTRVSRALLPIHPQRRRTAAAWTPFPCGPWQA